MTFIVSGLMKEAGNCIEIYKLTARPIMEKNKMTKATENSDILIWFPILKGVEQLTYHDD